MVFCGARDKLLHADPPQAVRSAKQSEVITEGEKQLMTLVVNLHGVAYIVI